VVRRGENKRWHVERTETGLTLSRRRPARFDLAVDTLVPAMEPLRLAHQVRQDVWRALRNLRGFTPAVRVAPEGGALRVTAGGAVTGPFPRRHAEASLRGVLEDADNRARWGRFAGAGRRNA
jgi:hypothetical protein